MVATFTDKICKVRLRREGHGILELEGKKFDLDRMPIGREIKVVADIYPIEEYERELTSLTANDKDIIGDKSVKLEGDTKIVAVFDLSLIHIYSIPLGEANSATFLLYTRII